MRFPLKLINKQNIFNNLDKAVFLVIMAVGLWLALQIYHKQTDKIKMMRGEITLQEDRISLGKEISVLNKDISNEAIPYSKKTGVLDKPEFNRLASLCGLKIASFIHKEDRDEELFEEELFNLTLNGGYHNLAKFISRLESRADILRVESLSFNSLDEDADEPGELSLRLSVRVVYIKI